MNHFIKIYGSLLRSTVWVGQPKHVKLTWLALLVLADAEGIVSSSIPGLAREAEITIEECEDALAVFMKPDPYSRTKAHEGRRIREVDGGWSILNHRKYREMRTRTQQLAAKRQAEFRAKKRSPDEHDPDELEGFESVTPGVTGVTSVTGVTRNASNAQRQRQRQRGIPKGDEVSAKDGSGNARAEADRTYCPPPDFKPRRKQIKTCSELALDIDDERKRFLAHQFKRNYSDWHKRFDEWLLDAEKFKHTPPPSRRNGAGHKQPNAGLDGLESLRERGLIDE